MVGTMMSTKRMVPLKYGSSKFNIVSGFEDLSEKHR